MGDPTLLFQIDPFVHLTSFDTVRLARAAGARAVIGEFLLRATESI